MEGRGLRFRGGRSEILFEAKDCADRALPVSQGSGLSHGTEGAELRLNSSLAKGALGQCVAFQDQEMAGLSALAGLWLR